MHSDKRALILCSLFLLAVPLPPKSFAENDPGKISLGRNLHFNANWKFKRCEEPDENKDLYKKSDYDDEKWEVVTLPHTPRIEPLVVNDQWQGICWYRKNFRLDKGLRGKKIYLEFEGAMQIADVWVNEKHKTTHYGGYLPFTIDITEDVSFEEHNIVVVKLDNRDNSDVPPGKPLKDLDFCTYGGLYRNVKLHTTDKLHITDAVYADKVAGGGIFVKYPLVEKEAAQVWVQTHIINEYDVSNQFDLITRLFDPNDNLVAENAEKAIKLNSRQDKHVVQMLDVQHPHLWHPYSPVLYKLLSVISRDNKEVDRVETTIGIRRISFDPKDGFRINGERFYLRGTNRHQEYPYIGYALSDNAHYRDALKIKKAGFDFVRLSHYPHSTAFMKACDELGLLVMDAIPGWQFFGNELFQQRSYQDCRDMIRRDRNHPSVILWEVSLNESAMSKKFMDKAHTIAHEEYPGDQCYTSGWIDYAYDLFIPARQHAKPPDYWSKYDKEKPILIAEYGDWEYYAQNAGFNQAGFKDLSPEERTSRQLRGHGQQRLLQQALNYQEAFNSNLASPSVGCANWLAFDYNRGYADDIEASGVFDLFRLPKFASYFFQSQRKPNVAANSGTDTNPVLFIADYWRENADSSVKVFSNCDEVELSLNGVAIARQYRDKDKYSGYLEYAPFTFKVEEFQPGELEAIGFVAHQTVASHKVRTHSAPERLRLSDSCDGIEPQQGKKDVFFVYASITDESDTIVPTAPNLVKFDLTGPGRLIGKNPVKAEAGIAAIVLETSGADGIIEIVASSSGLSVLKKITINVD